MSSYPKLVVTIEVEIWPSDLADVQHYIDTNQTQGNDAISRYMDDAHYCLRPGSETAVQLSIKPASERHCVNGKFTMLGAIPA